MNLTVRCIFVILLSFLFSASFAYCDEQRYSVPIGSSPAYGPANAPVTIIEFLDYQ
ncbi:MAG: hypothetical protein RBT37_03690 [Dissulfurispiraceae bacterium]|nr:hypothetical protein [Dissulfurispiraceae bacterium]